LILTHWQCRPGAGILQRSFSISLGV
jgi:hypothetical protein